jgi:hypothetical protein
MNRLHNVCRPKDAALSSTSGVVRTRNETYIEHQGCVCGVDHERAESGYRVFSHVYDGAHEEARTSRVNDEVHEGKSEPSLPSAVVSSATFSSTDIFSTLQQKGT